MGKFEIREVVDGTQLKYLKKIAQQTERSLSEFKGSYAGAMGYMQIMPSTFHMYGQDGDGDGILERQGQEFRLEILLRNGDPVREDGVMILRENLQEAGIACEIRILEHTACMSRARTGTSIPHSRSTARANAWLLFIPER